ATAPDLHLPAAVRTLDITDTLRAATSAVLAGLDAIAGSSAARVVVAAGDCRLAEPDSPTEQNFGDAGAALLLGAEAGLAEVIATHTVADEFLGTWRTREQEFPRAFPGAFEAKFGYGRVIGEVVKGVLAKARLEPRQLATVILPTPTPRAPQAVAKAAGLDAKRQLQESFWTTLGDTGAAQPLLMLAAALERAKADDLILVVGYGDGADPYGLEEVKRARRGQLFTFTNDYLTESPDPPVTHAVVDLDGGGRLYVQLTDCEPERVEIDMPLELTFRKIHEAGGFNNYFWKARPQ